MSRPARAAVAVLGLAALAGGLVLPIAALALDEARPEYCCSRGRCCCADGRGGADERPCLRRGCGCEEGGAVVAGAPLSLEAVMPAERRLTGLEPSAREARPASDHALARPHAPPVPPPRRLLPA